MEKEKIIEKAKLIIKSGDFNLFFIHKGKIYIGDEQSRISLAKMLDPKDEDFKYREKAYFPMFELDELIKGKPTKKIFDNKEIKEITVITDDKALKKIKERNFGNS